MLAFARSAPFCGNSLRDEKLTLKSANFDFSEIASNFHNVNTLSVLLDQHNHSGRTRLYIVLAFMLLAGIFGNLIAEDYYAVPIIIVGFGLFFAFCRVFFQGVLVEAVILCILLFGNIVGEWGFGHLHISSSIFVGEIGMIACFVVFGMRVAFTKERFIPRDPLSLVICAYVLVGTFRFFVDILGSWGNWDQEKDVLRDFAAVYYAIFYFITHNIFKSERSRKFVEGVFPIGILCLIPWAIAGIVDPDIFLKMSFASGQAIIYTRMDLAESFLGFGAIYFLLSREALGRWELRTLVALVCFALLAVLDSRAPLIGFGMCMIFLIIARKAHILRLLAMFSIVGAVALAGFGGLRGKSGEESFALKMKDKLLSVVDIDSQRTYQTDSGVSKGGNNHFRMEWWKAVYNETMENNPVFGLGFGYDLAARFLKTYDFPLDPEDFTTRSPHSIILSTFGRTGLVGVASLGMVVFVMLKSTYRCAVDIRRKMVPATDLAYWCGACIIFISSCLGVMLEGPMAAIVFWSLLGIASYRQQSRAEKRLESSNASMPSKTLRFGPASSRPKLAVPC